MVGKIILITGPMYSGKTARLVAEVKKAVIGQVRSCLIKHTADTRYTRTPLVVSHDGARYDAIEANHLLADPPGLPTDVKFIGIDEGQFFEGLADFCKRKCNSGVTVVVAALNGTSEQAMWPEIVGLLPLATIVYCESICIVCQGPAVCSRILESRPCSAPPSQEIEIGGDDKYVATCVTCFEKPIDEDVLNRRREAVRIAHGLSDTGTQGV